MKVDVLMDDEDIVIYPRCQVDDCDLDIRSVTYSVPETEELHAMLHSNETLRFDTIAQPCGHVQPNPLSLVWVTRDSEPDCGA